MKEYETTFIIDSLLKSEEIDQIIGKIEKFIINNGGQIINLERWGKKRLAYEIKKRQYGYYTHIQFQAPGRLIKLLEREYQLDENILRYLTIAVDKRALKARTMPQKQKEEYVTEPIIPESVSFETAAGEDLYAEEEQLLESDTEPYED